MSRLTWLLVLSCLVSLVWAQREPVPVQEEFQLDNGDGILSLLKTAVGLDDNRQSPESESPTDAKTPSQEPLRIVAMGDLHGSYQNTVDILRYMGIVDSDDKWIGGKTVYVQTASAQYGDVVDRGPDTIKLYALLQQLKIDAKLAGGEVVALLGNHEIMNLAGDWRYVTTSDIETFGNRTARQAAFDIHTGYIGTYLAKLPISARVNTTVFVHGGIHPSFAEGGSEGLNAVAKGMLPGYVKDPRHGDTIGIFHTLGPVWYRDYALEDEDVICPVLDEALLMLEAERMVIGHTVQANGRIGHRCDGRLITIDVGIGVAYGSHQAALEIIGSDVWAVYAGGKRSKIQEPLKRDEL
ncbi:hypothetical protein BZG36_01360 [Bifiguratus adelaidae]|uniref:Calcineurin-like phosphoesterase domain-containing protein n=1 Tax=Bifiguratus adelaidae TaxID=1938954 RepID=A0A261Y3E0_9FUNG|nr:hypothetical protein BZG36_01360 [Bifiguratus adelaidae]